MQVKVRIGWQEYIVQSEDMPTLMGIMSRITDMQGEMVAISMEKLPNLAREKMKEELTKEIGEELTRVRGYWMQEREKTAKLEKELKEKNDDPAF